jgi:hypothetical protein
MEFERECYPVLRMPQQRTDVQMEYVKKLLAVEN